MKVDPNRVIIYDESTKMAGRIDIKKPLDASAKLRLIFEGREEADKAIAVSTFINKVPVPFKFIARFFLQFSHIRLQAEFLDGKKDLYISKKSLALRSGIEPRQFKQLMSSGKYVDIVKIIYDSGQQEVERREQARREAEEKSARARAEQLRRDQEENLLASQSASKWVPKIMPLLKNTSLTANDIQQLCVNIFKRLNQGISKPEIYDAGSLVGLDKDKFWILGKTPRAKGSQKTYFEAVKVNIVKDRVRGAGQLEIYDQGSHAEVREENELAGRFNSEFIVKKGTLANFAGTQYLFMKKCDGSAGTLLQKQTTEVKLQVLRDTAKGIQALHDQDFIHRDIKPDNIFMLNNRGKLADLGYAIKADRVNRDDIKGTPLFLDLNTISISKHGNNGRPNFIPNENKPSKASDIYAFGLTMQEIFFNNERFSGKGLTQWKDMGPLKFLHHPPIVFIADETPTEKEKALAQLINEMITLDPSARPTIEQVVNRLEALM